MVFELSILICHTDNPMRNMMLKALELEFDKQIRENGLEGKVEVLVDPEPGSIGEKSNRLMDKAWGRYICRFDDDDFPRKNYLKRIFEGIEKDVDGCSLRGMYYEDGVEIGVFEHSLKYDKWETLDKPVNGVKFLRMPNHLNAMKKDKVKHILYPNISHGEDKVWSEAIAAAGVLKTEYYIDEILYDYKHVSNKRY